MSKQIQLKTLDIRNFKGISALHLTFQPGVNSLFGENATGKTSVYDALTWLLFDKDSHGNSKFSVKPVNAAPGVMPEVTAVLSVNGEELKLRKTLREKWEKKRGSSEARYAGDTRDYQTDGVPRKENEYKRIVAGCVDEAQFKMLTNVNAFVHDLHWKDRRALLAEICGLPSDQQILCNAPQFQELIEALGRLSVADYKTALTVQRKNSNASLNTLPIRIDECERSIAALSELPFDTAARQAAAAQQDIRGLQTELAMLDGDALLAQAISEKRGLEADLRALEAENHQYRASQIMPVADPRELLQRKLSDRQAALREAQQAAESAKHQIDSANARLEEYRVRYKAIRNEKGSVQEICPTCGQAIPKERVQAAKQKFLTEQKIRLDALVKDSAIIKTGIREQNEIYAQKQEQIQSLSQECRALVQELSALKPPEQPVLKDHPDYQKKRADLLNAIQNATERIQRIQENQQAERNRLQTELDVCSAQLREADITLAKKQQLKDLHNRVQELQQEQRVIASKMEQLDHMLALCEAFTQYKVRFIENSVNSHFQIARFRLFRQQINGSLEDCCDIMVNGVPYDDLNNAMKINVGLDIIETLSKHYNVRVPLFIDNAESVTKLAAIGSQAIRLVVSEADKELRLA